MQVATSASAPTFAALPSPVRGDVQVSLGKLVPALTNKTFGARPSGTLRVGIPTQATSQEPGIRTGNRILGYPWVPGLAVRAMLAFIGTAPGRVFSYRHRLKVIGVDAALITTQVVDGQPLGDRPSMVRVRQAMDILLLTISPRRRISGTSVGPCKLPAPSAVPHNSRRLHNLSGGALRLTIGHGIHSVTDIKEARFAKE